jgi:hypothetical protein
LPLTKNDHTSFSFLYILFIISLSINSSPQSHLLSQYPNFTIVSNVIAESDDEGGGDDDDDGGGGDDDDDGGGGDDDDGGGGDDDDDDGGGGDDDDDGGGGDDEENQLNGEYEPKGDQDAEDVSDDGDDGGGDEDFVPTDEDEQEDFVPTDEDEQEDFVPTDEDEQEDFVPTDEDEQEEIGEDTSKRNSQEALAFSESEIDCNFEWIRLTQYEQAIVNDLINLDSNAMRDYPYFIDLSFTKIKIILHCLDPFTLQKVLLNIPETDLISIYYGITSTEFNKILNRLHPDDELQIKYRLF